MKKLPIFAQLRDAQDRRISYLRVSVTDRCNYACTYCVPEGGVPAVCQSALLRFEEITRLVTLFAKMGVRRVRLTGGEPTIRKNIVELVGLISAVDGIEEVAMTSNAHLLETMAQPLAAAGLSSVNVSLDTLDPGPFTAITVRGDIARVIRGIEAAVAAGLRVSTNAVAIKGLNDHDLASLCQFAWERGAMPRFIEHMPMSGGDAFASQDHLSATEIRKSLAEELGEELHAVKGNLGRGPAQYWQVGESDQRFGIISAMSEHFCSTCNRVRLSATGHLHTCLAHDDTSDLRALLRSGANDAVIHDAIVHALSIKRDGHEFQLSGAGGPRKHMISIGG
ncbi:MAG: GTP 3',8-cyclase MoaA [Kofleriaceae bacterium]|nr:GTP 3',8-cyclase MoaA [Kofleriaceae bacterium]